MSRGVNKWIGVGNIGSDIESKDVNGKTVANFRMATNEEWKDKNGERQSRTEWHRIVAWGKLAEICAQFLSKGKQVYIEGRIQTRKWQDSDGKDRYTTEVVAHEMKMLGSKGDVAESVPKPADMPSSDDDDDLPF